jgi:hypothetical protein
LARRRRAIDNFVGHNLENQNGRRAILILQGFKMERFQRQFLSEAKKLIGHNP